MRLKLCLLFCFTCSVFSFAQTSVDSLGFLESFRDMKFGSSIEQIKKKEKRKPDLVWTEGKIKHLLYKGQVSGLNCDICYAFVNGELQMGAYLFLQRHTNPNLFIQEYDQIASTITHKYGPPIHDDIEWTNDLYKDTPEQWGFALYMGYLTYQTKWLFSNGSIVTKLYGDNFIVRHMVRYNTIDYDIAIQQGNESNSDF